MNPWDVFTWACSFLLAASSLLILYYFLAGLGKLLHMDEEKEDGH
jgi:hypothetical protein|tara:strand:- start:21363 stop:21497 length:135 start_codon:yes stop_codon:yes gene_type:complete